MNCEHKRVMSVNCVLHCMDCGEILPEGFLSSRKQGKNEPEAEKPVNGQAKKRTAKKAEKPA